MISQNILVILTDRRSTPAGSKLGNFSAKFYREQMTTMLIIIPRLLKQSRKLIWKMSYCRLAVRIQRKDFTYIS